jgi:genome maintenance exonuclease 1
MIINRKFEYIPLERVTNPDGTRYYTDPTSGLALPSVTTVLSCTADKEGIKAWEAWVGAEKAAKVKKEATDLGSLMHLNIENFVEGVERPRGNNLMRVLARRMADKIIENGLVHVDEVWGQEVGMYLPGLYAGTTDLVGIHRGDEAIMDHKSAKKLRTRDMIEDYMCQMAAYAVAHNEVYGTNIRKGVIFMVDRQLNYQEFILEGSEFDSYVTIFFNRVQTYLDTQVAA